MSEVLIDNSSRTSTSNVAAEWAPRILGIAFGLFIAIFALDAFNGRPLTATLPDFLIHLAPSAFLFAVAAIAWRREWVGGLVYLALAALYVVWAREHALWMALIGGPMAAVSASYFWSWAHRRHAMHP